jgi:hypothetical protein
VTADIDSHAIAPVMRDMLVKPAYRELDVLDLIRIDEAFACQLIGRNGNENALFNKGLRNVTILCTVSFAKSASVQK